MIQNNETNTISAIAVKSGPSVFNADSKKRQEQNFTAASKLAQQAKARYEAYIGYCYGKKKESGRGKPKMYQELAGKRFWAELTGDEDFYIKIIGYMGTISNTDINSSNVGGLYSYYKPAIQQARAILSLNFQSHNEKNGENEKGFVYTIPYTINMETLFEYYARTELKKALKGSEYRVEQYSKKLYLQKDIDNVDDAEKGIHLMSFCIPDIIIYKEDKPVVVIDAKYKLSGRPDRSDSHQLLSYVLLTGADRCGFVLPGEKTEVKEMVSTGDNYLPLAPRILRYYELLLGSKSDSSELQKVLQ